MRITAGCTPERLIPCVFTAFTQLSTENRSRMTIRLPLYAPAISWQTPIPPNCQYENSGGAPGGAASPLVTLKTVRSSTCVLIDCRLGGPVVPLVRI